MAAQRIDELLRSPEFGNYNTVQFVREILQPQYLDKITNRFETNLRLNSLINKNALVENLKTGNGRIYNDATVEQVLDFRFAKDHLKVGIYGITGPGSHTFCLLVV